MTNTKEKALNRVVPVFGPIGNSYCCKGPVSRALSAEDRRLAKRLKAAEMALYQGDYTKSLETYAKIPKDSPLFLSASQNGFIGALAAGDIELFDSILKDIDNFPKVNSSSYAELGVDLTKSWIRQQLRVDTGYPDWLVRMDLSYVPEEWRLQVAYFGTKAFLRRGNAEAAYAVASLLLLGAEHREWQTHPSLNLYLVCAIACRELGRKKEMNHWFRQAVAFGRKDRVILPFLGYWHGKGSPLHQIVLEQAPELLPDLDRLTVVYLKNMIRFHNHFTGGHVTEELDPREFYLAGQLKSGRSCQQIAELMGLSAGRVRNLASGIYAKLHITRRAELKSLMW